MENKYKNKNIPIEERVEDLLSKMSFEEKLQQMHCFGCVHTVDETIESARKGEDVIDTEFYCFKSITAKQVNEIQRFKREKTRLGIPAYISTECVHGAPLPFNTIFPTNGCLAATFDLDLAAKAAHIEGKELKMQGFNRVYSPNVDLLRDARWGRSGEDYGEDPYLVGKFGAESVKGLQAEGIEATVKHYLGYSMPEGGLNLGSAHIGEREIREYFLPSFEECIKAGAMGIMNCYNEIDGVPAGVSPFWMKKVLRDELHFDGDVITDYGLAGVCYSFHQVAAKDSDNLSKLFFDADIDIEACGKGAFGPHCEKLIESGKLDIEKVDNSVRRILRNKFKLGLFDEGYADETIDPHEIITKESRDLTYEIESKGAVLLKNDGVLPLKGKKHILLVGPNAMLAQLGGIVYYQFAEDGKHLNDCAAAKAIKTHEALISKFGDENVKVLPCCNFLSTKEDQIKEAIKLANEWADVVIFAGGNNAQGYSGGENGGANNPINLPDACTSNEGYDTHDIGITPSQKKLFNRLRGVKAPIVFLIYEGKPCSLTDEIDDISAVLYCFGVGMDGNRAIADILAGDVVPSGKLTFTIPKHVGQIPIFYNRKPLRGLYDRSGNEEQAGQDYVFGDKNPLFDFGDGLSYTTFEYSNLKVNKQGEKFLVSVDVKNTGNYDADESILVFTRSESNYLVCPNMKNLRSFKRVSLKKGEMKTANFELTKDDFSYIGFDMKKAYPMNEVKVIVKDLEVAFDINTGKLYE
mgnify:FL=1